MMLGVGIVMLDFDMWEPKCSTLSSLEVHTEPRYVGTFYMLFLSQRSKDLVQYYSLCSPFSAAELVKPNKW